MTLRNSTPTTSAADDLVPAATSRRAFLTRAGVVGTGAAAAYGGLAGLVGPEAAAVSEAPTSAGGGGDPVPGMFGRLFPELEPFAPNTPAVREALLDLGRAGGAMDAGDDLAAGPVALIVDPALNQSNRNNLTQTAGVTFLGQFLDHDITFDAASRLGVPARPERMRNSRSAALDLDSVYGGGPVAQGELYDPSDAVKLRVESGGRFEDVARRGDNSAIIGDPRNDSNLIVSGLHAAFLLFHNAAVDRLRARPSADDDPLRLFTAARRFTTWHYQWVIVHEFLPMLCGQRTVADVLARRGRQHPKLRQGSVPFIPVEFSGAAYRVGHSMVRPSYRANLAGDDGRPFFGLIFDPSTNADPGDDPRDLRGGRRAPRRFVGWQTFFDFGDGQVKPNKRLDTVLSTPLFQLPTSAIPHLPGSPVGPTSLPQRTLLRHLTWSLPSGQDVARRLGVPSLAPADLDDLAGYGLDFDRRTPLWFYVLREAAVVNDGTHLGPVGARIVAEVVLSLLRLDRGSYLYDDRDWRPTLAGRGGEFRMTDFLAFAGVDPASRGQ